MDSPERGALMLVRFTAVALICWALAELALYAVECHQKRMPMAVFPCLLKCLPSLLGLIMLIKARSLAGWISDKLDL